MEWRDEGICLLTRPHGEGSAILEAFTRDHGRHAGVVKGGAGRRMGPLLQPGAQLHLAWKARLDAHLGLYAPEPLRARSGLLSDRRALSVLNAVTGLLHLALPEREAHPALWQATVTLLDAADGGALPDPAAAYLRWELQLLGDLGWGLDLSVCALTGTSADLAYVSPTSGRAVNRAAAGDWAPRLLPLPGFLREGAIPASPADLAQGFALTGHFLARGLAPVLADRPLPAARARLAELTARAPP